MTFAAYALGAGILLGILQLAAHRHWKNRGRPKSPAGVSPLARIFRLAERLPDPFERIRRRRRMRLAARPFPEEWRQILRDNVPLYSCLPEAQRRDLERHVAVLVNEKTFEGCGGLAITDEIRVTIAAHAGLLLLGAPSPRYYASLSTILVYPSTYQARVTDVTGGVVTERQEVRHGESWHHGVVVLGWNAALAGARNVRDGDNLMLHEFAHQLDAEDGAHDGAPYLNELTDYTAWALVLSEEYDRLRARPHRSVLDAYGRTNPAEFFAVATEAFFEKPHQLRKRHPELYSELERYYRLDPANFDAPRPPQREPRSNEERQADSMTNTGR